MTDTQVPASLDSDALRANLRETAGEVRIDPRFQPLLEVVAKYKGLSASLEKLLYEICHPYHNWRLILPQLRGFLLKNCGYYQRHPLGPQTCILFGGIFFAAMNELRRQPSLFAEAVSGQLAWAEKLVSLLQPDDLAAYQEAIGQLAAELEHFVADDRDLPEQTGGFSLPLLQGQQAVGKIATTLLRLAADNAAFSFAPLASLLRAMLDGGYRYFLSEHDPEVWFQGNRGPLSDDEATVAMFAALSHRAMRERRQRLAALDIDSDARAALENLLKFPGFIDIVKLYREVPPCLEQAEERLGFSTTMHRFVENKKILFLFLIMDTAGLYLIHEETLREINRSLVQLIRQQTFEEIEVFLRQAFQLLKANVHEYPHTSLQCIQVLGDEVFDRGNSRMVEAFLWEAVRFGFQHANVTGVDENWQPLANPAHLGNIRVWLHLIMREPKWCSTLFSALIIHLKLSGTCVKDTDLFQRDITELLNHPIEPIYNLCKQFAKLMPVFYNEIGSEGELRDVSTELDETHRRRDLLIHFLRKQAHVESSNLIVGFIKAIFLFWRALDKTELAAFLPEEVFRQIDIQGLFIDAPHELSKRLWAKFDIRKPEDLLTLDQKAVENFLDAQEDQPQTERRRVALLIRMFRLLNQKYMLGFQEIREELRQAAQEGFIEVEPVLTTLDGGDTGACLEAILSALEQLKAIILSSETFPAQEDIYYKRHIAVDIPSVYGRYREKKFDALSLTFRLENLANLYLEKLQEVVSLNFITQATFFAIVRCLKIFLRALSVDGIASRRFSTYLALLDSSLTVRRFSYTQYLDIFRGLSEGVKDIIYAYYTNIHENNLSLIIPQIGPEHLLIKYRGLYEAGNMPHSIHRLSETFFRELIASTFGLQHLDNFIMRITHTLESQKDLLSKDKLDLLMSYNPEKAISSLERPNPATHDLIHMGNKGYNLATLVDLGMPVPPAFVITTEIFRCRRVLFDYSQARDDFMKRLREALTEIETKTGRRFGSPERPLLLSVRSGGAISMPGMMATVHNVGFNEDLIEEYVESGGNAYVAWDNYRRFLQSWSMVSGIDREEFQALMDEAKARHKVGLKWQFTAEQMRELALSYQKLIRKKGLGIPDDPWLQLVNAIELVFDSWDDEKAIDYRRIMDLSDSWGTAVVVQTMVLGNLSDQAGSGVIFTSHPYRKVQRVALWGDYAFGDQGEDIVSGLVTSQAISVEQAKIDGRSVENTLERRFPRIYGEMLAIARSLVYDRRWNPQEIEFTFEGPEAEKLYFLQTRDMITIKKKEHFQVFVDDGHVQEAALGRGVGVSGSALSGRAVFTEENILRLRREDQATPLILIRQDTVPEDIKVINMADGLLTARGGQTSHASVVAVRLEKTCVVGCRELKVYENQQYCEIGATRIAFGDAVSIDGRTGAVLLGQHQVREEHHIMPI
ncbi:MAG: phosphoenolpyruvate synthase [Desulfobulbaceae bacterium]|jgi:pyruvate,orthophosphate dikinase|nr:phosphoenolpyruvate synthase [Desulfobulbaceae bacterium]